MYKAFFLIYKVSQWFGNHFISIVTGKYLIVPEYTSEKYSYLTIQPSHTLRYKYFSESSKNISYGQNLIMAQNNSPNNYFFIYGFPQRP